MLVSLGANSPRGISLAPLLFLVHGSVGAFVMTASSLLGESWGWQRSFFAIKLWRRAVGKGAEVEEEVFWLLHAAAAATLWRWEVTEGGGRRGGTTCCDDQGDAGEGERENDPKRRCVLLAAPLPPFSISSYQLPVLAGVTFDE